LSACRVCRKKERSRPAAKVRVPRLKVAKLGMPFLEKVAAVYSERKMREGIRRRL
jgi:hypothetical protein